MFKTIEEGFAVYKAELVAYKKKLDELKEKYGGEILIQDISDADCRVVIEYSNKLRAMEETLGMMGDEIAAASKDAGIHP